MANVCSLALQKLASLMELDQATLRQQLTCLKAKSYSLQWTGGADATQGMCMLVCVHGCECVCVGRRLFSHLAASELDECSCNHGSSRCQGSGTR